MASSMSHTRKLRFEVNECNIPTKTLNSKFCKFAVFFLSDDPRFKGNRDRVDNVDALQEEFEKCLGNGCCQNAE